jgi:ABC-type phosphate/phosphonate transport system substrate-binding protein
LNNQYEPHFQSVVVTRTDSPIRSLADLAGKRLALPSPLSFSGNWVLNYEFKKHGLNLKSIDAIKNFQMNK